MSRGAVWWRLAGQRLPPTACYFAAETVLPPCRDRSGQRCPLHSFGKGGRAPSQKMNVNRQRGERSRIKICLSTVNCSSRIHTGKHPLTLCRRRRGGGGAVLFICSCRYGLRGLGVDARDVVLSCGSAHGLWGGLFIWWHLLILISIPAWCLVPCSTLRLYSGLH